MKKKLYIILPTILVTSLFLSGCHVNFGVKERNSTNEWDKVSNWSDNWTEDLGDWANDISSLAKENNSSNNNTGKIYEENLHETADINGISKIEISILASTVTINTIDSNTLTLDCVGSSNIVTNTTIEKTSNSIEIEEHGINSFNNGFDFGNTLFNDKLNRTVTIGIPKEYAEKLSIECGAGNLIINDINCNSLTVDGGAGNLTINNAQFKNLNLSQGVGNTDIRLTRKCGDIEIDGGVGNIFVSMDEVGGNLTYSGGVGDATINIPENSPVKISTESGIGHTSINAKTSGDTYTFDLSVGVGKLTVN